MDIIVHFFRDILSGPLYTVVAVISGTLICSCIGYLAERSLLKKKSRQEYKNSHVTVSSDVAQSQSVNVNQSSGIQNQQSAVDINAAATGVPTAIGSSDALTSSSINNSQNVGQ